MPTRPTSEFLGLSGVVSDHSSFHIGVVCLLNGHSQHWIVSPGKRTSWIFNTFPLVFCQFYCLTSITTTLYRATIDVTTGASSHSWFTCPRHASRDRQARISLKGGSWTDAFPLRVTHRMLVMYENVSRCAEAMRAPGRRKRRSRQIQLNKRQSKRSGDRERDQRGCKPPTRASALLPKAFLKQHCILF